ncbi:hypothetical protein C8R45DRAFT_1096440 [Mycena sanguinolenta]|nr:hypothetical protein C8R45DRAFT_1096440 [Mycena sanguinolenta]
MPRVLTLLRRSQSLPLPRRDAYPLSTAFGLTGTKAARYRSIQATITQALVTLAGPMPEGLPRDFSGHTLIRPRMNTGATRLKDAGEYFQRCKVHTNCCFAYYPLTDPLAREILEIDWIQELFDIRQELAPARRMQRAPRIQQNQVISAMDAVPTQEAAPVVTAPTSSTEVVAAPHIASMAVDIEAVDIDRIVNNFKQTFDRPLLSPPTRFTPLRRAPLLDFIAIYLPEDTVSSLSSPIQPGPAVFDPSKYFHFLCKYPYDALATHTFDPILYSPHILLGS